MNDFATIRLEFADSVASITLNRPESLNALNREMLAELAEALAVVSDGGRARALLISGAGRGFCAGTDLKISGLDTVPSDYDAGDVLDRYYNPLIERLFSLPLPIVAAVHGPVSGAGCMIALAADFVVAAKSAYFLQAFIKVGLIPDAGSLWLLPRLVGRARAHSMMMLGERIPAETALEWGMIHQVVEDELLHTAAEELVTKLSQGPTRAYAIIRQGTRLAMEQPLSEALELERRSQCLAGRTADFAEGVCAFRAKRPARFTGQ